MESPTETRLDKSKSTSKSHHSHSSSKKSNSSSATASKRRHSSDEENDYSNNNNNKKDSSESDHDLDNNKSYKSKSSFSSSKKSNSKSNLNSNGGSSSNRDNNKESKSSSSKKKPKQDDEKDSKSSKKSDHKSRSNDNNNESNATSNGGGGDLSLSIEETNKLRAKLGLKPLDSNSTNKASSTASGKSDEKKTYIDKDTNQEFEHVPAKNIAEIREQKDFKQKLEEQREKRLLIEKLRRTKGLGDDSSDEDEESKKKAADTNKNSAELWVKKLKEKEKEAAQRKEKLLLEMDQQFDDEAQTKKVSKKKQQQTKDYSSDHLKGLKVEHDQSYFKEGQEIILTLKDRNILKGTGDNLNVDDDDEESDVLVNVNILDDEKAAKNNENKKKKGLGADYKPYDDFDEDGSFRQKSILDKYNEELNGESKKSFKLGAKGLYDASDEKFIERLNQEHKSKAIKLDILSDFKMASDYLTPQEVVEKFKKPKKKMRKELRNKNKLLKADDLLPLPMETTSAKNAIGISKTNIKIKEEGEESDREDGELKPSFNKRSNKSSSNHKISLKDIDFELKKSDQDESDQEDDDDDDDEDNDIDVNKLREAQEYKEIIEEENNALEELHSVLSKTRMKLIKPKEHQLLVKEEPSLVEQSKTDGISFDNLNTIVDKDKNEDEGVDEDDKDKGLVLDTLSEFCRNLGKASTSNGTAASTSKHEEDDDEMEENAIDMNGSKKNGNDEEEEQDEENEDQNGHDDSSSDEMQVSNTSSNLHNNNNEDGGILDDEPVIDRGLAAALKLAVNKGYLAKEKHKQNARLNKASIEAVNFTIEEKNYYDIDDKYSRNRDRFSGPLTDFDEKSNYKPDVKLDYIDEKGHNMNEKEAFRYLSHRFHGKGSGKKKTEKRFKKLKEMETMNKMSSVDTPLNTVALLIEKQKRLQQPFVVLSTHKGKQDQVTLHKR